MINPQLITLTMAYLVRSKRFSYWTRLAVYSLLLLPFEKWCKLFSRSAWHGPTFPPYIQLISPGRESGVNTKARSIAYIAEANQELKAFGITEKRLRIIYGVYMVLSLALTHLYTFRIVSYCYYAFLG